MGMLPLVIESFDVGGGRRGVASDAVSRCLITAAATATDAATPHNTQHVPPPPHHVTTHGHNITTVDHQPTPPRHYHHWSLCS